MRRPPLSRRSVRRPLLLVLTLTAGLTATAAACSDDAPDVKLSAAGAKGKAVAAQFNCASCHSTNGDELTGPTWKDLYGASVTLKGGEKVTVDDAYIERAIREPNAERRDDATGQMPTFDEDRLSDDQLAEIVAYLKDLSADETTAAK
jgi:cytochrome c oxidase subunit 2